MLSTLALFCLLAVGAAAAKPNRVILISIDGMHSSDLAWASSNLPNLMMLANNAVIYNNAYIQANTDSFPGVLALTAGANPKTTGVYYDDSYSRDMWAPGTNCSGGKPQGPPGAEIVLDESVDLDNSMLLAGGNGMGRNCIDPSLLPLDASCMPVYPHTFNRANTIFSVAKEAGLKTAWTDKHPAYDLLSGPNGTGIDQLFTPEINSLVGPNTSTVWTDPAYTPAYDRLHAAAIISWIHGLNVTNQAVTGWSCPDLLGGNFQSVSTAQKLWNVTNAHLVGYKGAYSWDGVTPNNVLQTNFAAVDSMLGSIMEALEMENLLSNFTVIISSKHGQSPKDATMTNLLPTHGAASVSGVLAAAGIKVSQNTQDDVSLIWLANSSDAAAGAAALEANKAVLGITECYAGDHLLALGWAGNPATDPRAPDIICDVVPGTIYVGNPAARSKCAEHGGLNEDDRHVGLLVWQKGLKPKSVNQKVYTTQVAPSVLRLLGLNPSKLDGVKKEGTLALPGLRF